jgi:cell division GTPase FtsZ
MELQALHEASPDLLEALKEAQAVLAVFWMGDHAGRPLADKIQAAIDKAERKAHEARQ